MPLISRMLKIKRSVPREPEYFPADLSAGSTVPMEARAGVPLASHARELLYRGGPLLYALRRYYRGHRSLVHGVGGALLLAAAAACWLRYRKSI